MIIPGKESPSTCNTDKLRLLFCSVKDLWAVEDLVGGEVEEVSQEAMVAVEEVEDSRELETGSVQTRESRFGDCMYHFLHIFFSYKVIVK